MTTVLLALLAVSDVPLVEALPEPAAVEVTQRVSESASAPGVNQVLGWGLSLSTLGVTGIVVAGVIWGMLASASARCAATRGCFDESGLAYIFPVLPLLVGVINASVGFPLIGRAIFLQRQFEAEAAVPVASR